MLRRVAEASAELAAREEWLHWIEHGTTMRPEADGEWGFRRVPTTRPGSSRPSSPVAPSDATRPGGPGPRRDLSAERTGAGGADQNRSQRSELW